MKKGDKFNPADRLKSFRYAFRGIMDLMHDEHNFRIHLAVLTVAIVSGFLFGITFTEWLAVIFVAALVLVSESFNTAIENLADIISPEADERIRKIKDIAAAAVFFSAVIAVITGIIIFLPYLIKLFS